jgi:hypothetical protein
MRLILFLIAAFCRLAKSLSYYQQMGWMVGAVGIEVKAILKTHKLLILLNAKDAKNAELAQAGYTGWTVISARWVDRSTGSLARRGASPPRIERNRQRSDAALDASRKR